MGKITALRGAAAFKQRINRENRNNAAVIPFEKVPCSSPDIWCKEGELLKHTRKGFLVKKHQILDINSVKILLIKIMNELLYLNSYYPSVL
jgi:Auxin canalisation